MLLVCRLLAATLLFSIYYFGCAAVTVSPVELQLGKSSPIATLRLKNTSTTPISYQVQAYRWLQHELQPVDSLIVSPPIFTIKPQSTQVIRIGFDKLQLTEQQRAYRIIAKQLPSSTAKNAPHKKINLLFNLSIPLLVEPQGVAKRQLQASVVNQSGHSYLRLDNQGNIYMSIEKINVSLAKQPVKTVDLKNQKVLLASSQDQWQLPYHVTDNKSPLKFDLQTGWGDYHVNLHLAQQKQLIKH